MNRKFQARNQWKQSLVEKENRHMTAIIDFLSQACKSHHAIHECHATPFIAQSSMRFRSIGSAILNDVQEMKKALLR